MAGYFPKRKKDTGPNKNEKKVLRAEDERRQGSRVLGNDYPLIKRVSVQLKFLNPQRAVIGEETRAFGASDRFDFSAPCPGSCGEGTFDLEGRIAKMVEGREASAEANGKCQRQRYGSPDPCGCELNCRIDVVYSD